MISIHEFKEWLNSDERNKVSMEFVLQDIFQARCGGRRDYVMVDGGAHKGFHTKKMLDLPGCEKVYAIEADPFMAEVFEGNIAGCVNRDRVELVQKALQRDSNITEVKWKSSFSHTGRSSVVSNNPDRDSIWAKNPDMQYRSEIVVLATTIDQVLCCEDRDLPFLKLDLEGADLFSLLGARVTLKYRRPVIAFENSVHAPEVFGFTLGQILSYFDTYDYVPMNFVGDEIGVSNWFDFLEAWAAPREDVAWLRKELQRVLKSRLV
jgi:FkbM family methyltransferase